MSILWQMKDIRQAKTIWKENWKRENTDKECNGGGFFIRLQLFSLFPSCFYSSRGRFQLNLFFHHFVALLCNFFKPNLLYLIFCRAYNHSWTYLQLLQTKPPTLRSPPMLPIEASSQLKILKETDLKTFHSLAISSSSIASSSTTASSSSLPPPQSLEANTSSQMLPVLSTDLVYYNRQGWDTMH